MKRKSDSRTNAKNHRQEKSLSGFNFPRPGSGQGCGAAFVYAAFALYLIQPHFERLARPNWLIPVNLCLSALGCYVLSRRWVGAFAASLFAGALYGFGPFMLNLTRFHPAAGCLAAAIPWLFCPAAFLVKKRHDWKSIPLLALPFIAIALFFHVSAHYRLFAIPIRFTLQWTDLIGLIVPLTMASHTNALVGFYHVPAAALTMGLAMSLAGRRAGSLTLAALGIVLASADSFLQISPVIWLTIPIVCASVLIGAGMQGLACAGFADRKWVLLAATVTGVLAIATLLLATKYFQAFFGFLSGFGELLTYEGKFYILATITTAAIFFMTTSKLRSPPLRWTILCLAMAVDIFFSAGLIIDRVL